MRHKRMKGVLIHDSCAILPGGVTGYYGTAYL